MADSTLFNGNCHPGADVEFSIFVPMNIDNHGTYSNFQFQSCALSEDTRSAALFK